ncbi:HvfA family oxazolone/thioamide-modified RiPP metallophore [Methylomarinum vadi]|uniref:HvfA family oxazolone/thioamide-modified RiPP metallophore n=1 Tax=Methylomarinum vadi TaxID=438855 RepID=UPI0004DF6D82|nr:hypothetical protein [Methylomarinum vadi]
MKKNTVTPFAIALGTSLVSGLSATAAQANNTTDRDSNPFAMTELSSGYLQTAQADKDSGSKKMKGGSCGEGKCGGAMMQGNEEKTVEGKCAGNKPMPKDKSKGMEGKCGEGKCGASMQ